MLVSMIGSVICDTETKELLFEILASEEHCLMICWGYLTFQRIWGTVGESENLPAECL